MSESAARSSSRSRPAAAATSTTGRRDARRQDDDTGRLAQPERQHVVREKPDAVGPEGLRRADTPLEQLPPDLAPDDVQDDADNRIRKQPQKRRPGERRPKAVDVRVTRGQPQGDRTHSRRCADTKAGTPQRSIHATHSASKPAFDKASSPASRGAASDSAGSACERRQSPAAALSHTAIGLWHLHASEISSIRIVDGEKKPRRNARLRAPERRIC